MVVATEPPAHRAQQRGADGRRVALDARRPASAASAPRWSCPARSPPATRSWSCPRRA